MSTVVRLVQELERVLSSCFTNPDQNQGRFPLAKQRRQHLHQIIDRNHCDLTHM